MIYEHNIKIDIPVFKLDSKIAYQTVRRPTVFEKSVLQLFARHSGDLGEYTLEDIAKKLKLCSIFFVEALRYLSDFKAIEFLNGYSIDDGAGLQCNSILITNEGREFLAKNALPSKSKNTTETSYYHPLSGALVGKNQIKTDSYPDVKRLPIEGMNVTLSAVEPLLDEQLRRSWESKANERIESISSQFNGELWDRKTFKIDINHNGNVTPISNDEDFSKWLDGAEAEYLWQYVVSPVFSTNSKTKYLKIDWSQVRDVAPIEKANDLVNKQKPHYVFTLDDSIEVDVATVILAPSSETLLIGKVLTLKECSIEFEAGVDALIVNKSNVGFEFKSGLSEISYRGHPREVDLAIIAQADKKKDEFEQFLLTNDDINVVIFSAVIDCQQAIDRLPNAHVSQVFEYYKKMKQFIPDLHANSFKDKVKRLRHKEEVAEYIQLFEERELLIDILTPDCLITLIDIAIKQSDVMDGLFITQALTDLANPYASLKNKTAVDLLTLSNFELLKLNVPRYKLLNELSDQIDVLYKMLSASVFNNSTLGGLREKTSDALAHFNAKYADPQQINKRVVVIDTNCLMHNLNLLDRVKPSDQLVIPVIVLDELDGLKEDKNEGEWSDKAKRARAAIDRLIQFNSYEPQHLELLEKMDKDALDSPDLKILSVAVYYRLCNSILLTDDKNLRNLANAEGIASQSTQEYLVGSSNKKSKKRKGK